MKILKNIVIMTILISIAICIVMPLQVYADYGNNSPSVVPPLDSTGISNDAVYGGHAGFDIIAGEQVSDTDVKPYLPFSANLKSKSQAWSSSNKHWIVESTITQTVGTQKINYIDAVCYYYFDEPQLIQYAQVYFIYPESNAIYIPDSAELVYSDDGETWTKLESSANKYQIIDDTSKKSTEGKEEIYIQYAAGKQPQPPEISANYWGIEIKIQQEYISGTIKSGLSKIFLSTDTKESERIYSESETGLIGEDIFITITPTKEVIHTGINTVNTSVTADKTSYEIDCILPSYETNQQVWFMGINGKSIGYQKDGDYNYVRTHKGTIYYPKDNVTKPNSAIPNNEDVQPFNRIYTYKMDGPNGKLYMIDKNTQTVLKELQSGKGEAESREIYVGGRNLGNGTWEQANGIRIKTAKIWNGETLMWNGIACVDGYGTHCMYDYVSGRYFYLDGSSSPAGVVINEPSDDPEIGGVHWPEEQEAPEIELGEWESDSGMLNALWEGVQQSANSRMWMREIMYIIDTIKSIFEEDYSSGQAGLDALGVFNITLRKPTQTEEIDFGNEIIGPWVQTRQTELSDIDYGLNNQRIVDFSWFFGTQDEGSWHVRGVKYYSDIIISGFLWIVFIWYLWHNFPTIIGGDIMSNVSTGISAKKEYTGKKHTESRK